MSKAIFVDYADVRKFLNNFDLAGRVIIGSGLFIAVVGTGRAFELMERLGTQPSVDSSLALILAALPGLAVAFAGMICIAIGLMAQSTVHTAELTQEMLGIARTDRPQAPTAVFSRDRNGEDTVEQPAPSDPRPEGMRPFVRQEGPKVDPEEGVLQEEYRGFPIFKHPTGMYIGKQWYPNLSAARKAIDAQADPAV